MMCRELQELNLWPKRRPRLFDLRSQQPRLSLVFSSPPASKRSRMAGSKKSSPNGKQKSPKGKGKAAAVPPSPPAKASSPLPVEAEDNDLLELAESITAKAHLLAPGLTDAELAQKAQDVVKASFDRGAFFWWFLGEAALPDAARDVVQSLAVITGCPWMLQQLAQANRAELKLAAKPATKTRRFREAGAVV